MVGDHDALRADIGGHHGIVFVEDALDDEVALPALVNAFDVLPVQVVAARGIAGQSTPAGDSSTNMSTVVSPDLDVMACNSPILGQRRSC